VALVGAEASHGFVVEVGRAYAAEVTLPSAVFACDAVGGARLHDAGETSESRAHASRREA
jgi:hypothetical protein